MTMFSKIDKKVLIILIAIIVAILLIVFFIYKYIVSMDIEVQNSAGGAQAENDSSAPQVEIETGGSGEGTLIICLDKCGDNVCQAIDSGCGEEDNLNCICPETPQDCPQDCK